MQKKSCSWISVRPS
jgi:hypothetical protein